MILTTSYYSFPEAKRREEEMEAGQELNVLGGRLELCSVDPMTGFTREGCCTTGPMDIGSHTVSSE